MTNEEAIRFGEAILRVADKDEDGPAIEFATMTINLLKKDSAHGVWTIDGPKGYAPGYFYRCSNCQNTQGYGVTAYCPHCGARMKEDES